MEWISVKDRLPLVGQEVLFCSNGKEFLPTTFGLYLGEKSYPNRFYSHDCKSYNATHWISLHEPPRDKEESQYIKGWEKPGLNLQDFIDNRNKIGALSYAIGLLSGIIHDLEDRKLL